MTRGAIYVQLTEPFDYEFHYRFAISYYLDQKKTVSDVVDGCTLDVLNIL